MATSYVGKGADGEPIYDGTKPKPVLRFRGCEKLHATSPSVVRKPDGELVVQSRARIVNPGEDSHYGFYTFVHSVPKEVWEHLFAPLVKLADGKTVGLFGEWCGTANIQGGKHALAKLPFKCFAIFGACTKEEEDAPRIWFDMAKFDRLPASPEHKIFNLLQPEFQQWELEIDFNRPELIQNKLVEITEAVEKCSPFCKAVAGVEGVGEGVVWSCWAEGWKDAGYWFKCKGKEHTTSHTKTLAPIDVEKVATMYEFADKVCTRARLEQGLTWLKDNGKEISQRSTGDFLRWLVGDVLKEERDTMEASGLEEGDIGRAVGTHGRKWFFEQLNEQVGLKKPETQTKEEAVMSAEQTPPIAASASSSIAYGSRTPVATSTTEPAAAPTTNEIPFDAFTKVDLRAAKVLSATIVEGSDKLLAVKLDVGPLGERDIFAGLRQYVEPATLVDKTVVLVANLAPRKMRFGTSYGMMLAAGEPPVLVLAEGAKPGDKIG